jgi:hypothetical protein
LIDRNYCRKSSWTIYNDEGSTLIINRANVLEGPYDLAYYGGDYGRKHNLLVEKSFATSDQWNFSSPGTKGVDNAVIAPGQWPEEARAIIEESGLEPAWKKIIPADWQQVSPEMEGIDLAWAKGAIDFVVPGTQSESTHLVSQRQSQTGPAHGKIYRQGEEFVYRMKFPVGKKSALVATYWGEEGQKRKFQVWVNDKLLATQELFRAHPGQFFEETYAVSPDMLPATDGDQVEATVRFSVVPDGYTVGGLFGLKVISTP